MQPASLALIDTQSSYNDNIRKVIQHFIAAHEASLLSCVVDVLKGGLTNRSLLHRCIPISL